MLRIEGGSILQMRYFTLCEQAVLALSLLAIGFLLIDPFMLERAWRLSDSACDFFKFVTDLGRSHWMLFPTAAILVFAIVMRRRHLGFRNEAGYGLMIGAAGATVVFWLVSGGSNEEPVEEPQPKIDFTW